VLSLGRQGRLVEARRWNAIAMTKLTPAYADYLITKALFSVCSIGIKFDDEEVEDMRKLLKARGEYGARLDQRGDQPDFYHRFSRLPTASGGIARHAYARCAKANINADMLLRTAGLPRASIDNPDVRIAVQSQIEFLNLAAEALGDEWLGFHLAQRFELREAGLGYYVMASSDLLGDALQRCARYSGMTNEGARLSYRAEKQITLRVSYEGVARHPDRHQIEFFMTTLVRACRDLTGQQVRPQRVTLSHLRTGEFKEIKEYFGCPVLFGDLADEVIFSKGIERMQVSSADPYLNALLLKYCEEARARRSRAAKASPLRLSVENTIAPLLPHGKGDASEVARWLGLSERTLARRLKSEGLSFAGILHDLRYDLARTYLGESSLSVSKVAWLLGYGEVSSFSSAFKRWSGKSPRQARAA
jgi:AraC-like DNA-binding protein